MSIICPLGWDRVNWSAKIWGCHGTTGTPRDDRPDKYLLIIVWWIWIIFHGFNGQKYFVKHHTKTAHANTGCLSAKWQVKTMNVVGLSFIFNCSWWSTIYIYYQSLKKNWWFLRHLQLNLQTSSVLLLWIQATNHQMEIFTSN